MQSSSISPTYLVLDMLKAYMLHKPLTILKLAIQDFLQPAPKRMMHPNPKMMRSKAIPHNHSEIAKLHSPA